MKREKVEFFDEVLTSVGKTSNLFGKNTLIEIEDEKPASVPTNGPVVVKAMNGLDFVNMMKQNMLKEPATIPTLEDLKKSKPDIYDQQLKLATNNRFVIFNPEHCESNKYGFLDFELRGAYKRIKDNVIILVGDGLNVYALTEDKNYLVWLFRQDGTEIERMLKSQPGMDFSGSRRRKCYRLNQNEINDLVDNKIFLNGGIDIAPKQRGIEDLGDGLFSINF